MQRRSCACYIMWACQQRTPTMCMAMGRSSMRSLFAPAREALSSPAASALQRSCAPICMERCAATFLAAAAHLRAAARACRSLPCFPRTGFPERCHWTASPARPCRRGAIPARQKSSLCSPVAREAQKLVTLLMVYLRAARDCDPDPLYSPVQKYGQQALTLIPAMRVAECRLLLCYHH